LRWNSKRLLRKPQKMLGGYFILLHPVCVAWHKGLWHALSLPGRNLCDLLPHITGMLHLKDELLYRTVRFVANSLNCENSIVQFVSHRGVYFGRTGSLVGLNAQLCSMWLNLPLIELNSINVKHVRCLASPDDDRHRANVIYYLLLVKSNLADVPILSSTDEDFIIDNLCVCVLGLL